jgi:hypothetical protein
MRTQTQIQIDRQDRQNTKSRRCTANRADGLPCRAYAVHGTDPPRCAPHGGGRAPVGAPIGNQNARTHGFYASSATTCPSDEECTIDKIIADLYGKQKRLSRYIDEEMDALSPAEMARLLSIHAQTSSRLGRLLCNQHTLTGGWNEGMDRIIEQTLAELGEEWGVDLV